MTDWEVIHNDVRDWSKTYKGEPFMALLCDAPYEISFMNSPGDSSGISFESEMWKGLAQHLYPGAFLFVMAGTINDDLISVALREAGLRKFHRMLGWSYGTGFCKATKISSQIDDKWAKDNYGGWCECECEDCQSDKE